jgi:hypothetical protein
MASRRRSAAGPGLPCWGWTLAPHGQAGKDVAPIERRLSQERFVEMPGVSRQTVTTLVRAFVRQGLVHWHYGQITLLDRPGLQALADAGVDRLAQSHAARAPRRSAVAANGWVACRLPSTCCFRQQPEGQTIKVTLKPQRPSTCFDVNPPGSDPSIFIGSNEGTVYKGRLPASGV